MSASGIIPDPGYGGLVVRSLPAPAGVTNAYVPPEGFTVSTPLTYYGGRCASNRFDPQQLNAFESEMLCLAATLSPGGTWNAGSVTNLGDAFQVWADNFSAAGGISLTHSADYPSTVDTAGATAAYVGTAILSGLATSADYPAEDASNVKSATPAYVSAAITAAFSETLSAVAFSGAYADLTGKPTLATVATSGAYSDLTGKPSLATVATSGAFADLTGKPTNGSYALSGLSDINIIEGSGIDGYSLVWNNGTGKWIASAPVAGVTTLAALTDVNVTEGAGIDGKVLAWDNATSKWIVKTLATVAISGAYSDLSGRPTLATVATSGAYSDLSGRPTLATVATSGAFADLSGKPTNATYALSGLSDITITSAANSQRLRYDSGTSKWINEDSRYDLGLSISGVMANNEVLLQYVAPVAFKIPSGASGSYAKANTAATGSLTVTLKKNGTSVGTIAWSSSGTSGTFTVSADITLTAGDILQLIAPALADATLADIGVTLAGTRT